MHEIQTYPWNHFCEAQGCETAAHWQCYCDRCAEEITALQKENARSNARRQRRHELWGKLTKRIWIFNLLALAAGIAYLMADGILAWAEWLQQTGVQ